MTAPDAVEFGMIVLEEPSDEGLMEPILPGLVCKNLYAANDGFLHLNSERNQEFDGGKVESKGAMTQLSAEKGCAPSSSIDRKQSLARRCVKIMVFFRA